MTSSSRRRFVVQAAATALSSTVAGARSATRTPPIRPFRVAVSDARLREVLTRVRSHRAPRLASGTGWQYGVDRAWFADVVHYWSTGYDWRRQEAAINRLPQFRADVLGRRLHFAHLPGVNASARPLLLLHGWPYSFYSFSEVAPSLAGDFHVVVPSLPGFGFSDPVSSSPRGLRAMAAHLHALMTQLGYERYLVQGSDHGAVIADWLALDWPAAVIGEQTNLIALRHAGAEYASGQAGVADPTDEELAFVRDEQATFRKESAYFELQRTRPETIAWAMADSPVGMAAYLLDKWQKWTDTGQRDLDAIYGRDRLLTEVMLYVVSDSFPTSLWPYAGFALEPFSIPPGRTVDVPFGFSGYPDPLNAPPPRRFVERGRTGIVQWEVADRGGHFPFLENPGSFVSSVRRFSSLV